MTEHSTRADPGDAVIPNEAHIAAIASSPAQAEADCLQAGGRKVASIIAD